MSAKAGSHFSREQPSVFVCYSVAAEFPDGGGVGHRVRRIADGLRRRHSIPVTCLRLARDFPEAEAGEGEMLFRFSALENWFSLVRRLACAVPESTSVMLLNGEPLEYETCCRLRGERGVRCVSVVCTDSPHYYQIASTYGPVLDAHIALTGATAERLRKMLGPVALVQAIHTGVQTSDPPVGGFVEREAEHPLRLLYVGRIIKAQKAVFRLVDVLSRLVELGTPVQLAVVGTGPDEAGLLASFCERGVADRVSFVGHVDSDGVRSQLRRSHVFLLTSVTEGLSNALLEAMMHGCVPIAMDVPGIREVICHGLDGFVVPQGDCEEMASRVAELASSGERLVSMRRHAHHTARLRFSQDRMVDEYAALLRRLHGMGPSSGPSPSIPVRTNRLDQRWLPNWLTVLLRRARKVARP